MAHKTAHVEMDIEVETDLTRSDVADALVELLHPREIFTIVVSFPVTK